MQENRSLYFVDNIYTWNDFDEDAAQLQMNRSQFLVYLYRQWKEKRRFNELGLITVLLLIGFSVCIFLLTYLTFWRL